MSEKNETLASYVDAACELHQLSLSSEERERVARTLAITAGLVAPLMALDLPPETDPAPVYIP
jgi:hypothetical protein